MADVITIEPFKDRKKEADLTAVVDAQLPPAVELANNGKLHEALELLLNLEKQTRAAADLTSSTRVLVQIIRLCFQAQDWKTLNEYIVLLMKKRGQLKQAMTNMIQEAMTFLEKTPSMDVKLELIDTLRQVTEGKIFVEVERARLTRILAKIREDEGKIAEAAEVLQQMQVETFGSMDRREKTDFILEQMRLLLAKKDFVRTAVVSKKISMRYFDKEDVQDLKLRFFQLMIEYGDHEENYLDVSKYYYHIYQTPIVQADLIQRNQALRGIALYVILAPYDNEQSDLLNRVFNDKNLEHLPVIKNFLKAFITQEIMFWSDFEHKYRSEVLDNSAFKTTERAEAVWKVIHDRVVEHNIRVIAKYYTKITLNRLSELLNLSAKDTETFLSRLIVAKTIYGRIDRPAGFVTFAPRKDPNAMLNAWSTDIGSLLNLIERSTHLITKEEMVHTIQVK